MAAARRLMFCTDKISATTYGESIERGMHRELRAAKDCDHHPYASQLKRKFQITPELTAE